MNFYIIINLKINSKFAIKFDYNLGDNNCLSILFIFVHLFPIRKVRNLFNISNVLEEFCILFEIDLDISSGIIPLLRQ